MNDISVDGSPVSDSLEKENNRGLLTFDVSHILVTTGTW